MAWTLLDIQSDNVDVERVYLDRADDGTFILKQYPEPPPAKVGDWVAMTPKMLRELAYFVIKEGF
ncbi:MAG: hypothetical protein ACR2PS_05605 [Pseudomonadales bacterium]